MRVVLLDSGPLGLVTNPKRSEGSLACAQWLTRLLLSDTHVIVPEIADYEVRRELLRAGKRNGLKRLDHFVDLLDYLPLNTVMMRHAAMLWAQVRQAGMPTADRHALDGDVILAAQALSIADAEVIIATTNVKHLARLTTAHKWTEIDS